MVFEFKPTIWFVCRLCRDAFSDMEQLKFHKLESHLAESLNVKCIVFEEKLLDYEWIPPPPQFSFDKQDQLFNSNDMLPGEAMKDLKIVNHDDEDQMELKVNEKVIKNHFVSLTKLTAQELNSTAASATNKMHPLGTKNTFEQEHNFALAEKNRKLLAKRKQNSESNDGLLSFKQRKTADGDHDEVHKTKVRELLSSAVMIRNEACNNNDDRICFVPQNLPPAPVPAATSLKLEFIDYDLIADQNVEIVPTKQPQQMLWVNVNSASQLTSESAPNSGAGAGTGTAHPCRQPDNKTQLKPSTCPICSASFRTKRRLGQHKLIHSKNVRL